MKLKHGIILLISAVIGGTVGGLFKVLHWASANILLTCSTFLLVVALLIILVKGLSHPRISKFLNE